ncbi:phosphotransferase [Mycoplasma simbae]|uniref:phosphotransferase n=1 Tax=Mycoplasma simbae TaxID=36744 RepID=UPI000497D823|nr:phosphotransferase [Mycoplasma simbae]
MKIRIQKGHTNRSFQEGNVFVQEKVYNGFNHKIDYQLLSNFDFVPMLISNDTDLIKWEFIEGVEPTINLTNASIIAQQVRQIHQSNLKFPPSNHAARVKQYRRQMKELSRTVPVLEKFFRPINQTLAKMDKSTPLHNDLWPFNMIQTSEKIYFVDWEYATMGDKHFELAYIIEASGMDSECEQAFLQAYGSYSPLYLLRHKILVNYLVILWVHTQTQPPFDTDKYEKRILELDSQLQKLLNG